MYDVLVGVNVEIQILKSFWAIDDHPCPRHDWHRDIRRRPAGRRLVPGTKWHQEWPIPETGDPPGKLRPVPVTITYSVGHSSPSTNSKTPPLNHCRKSLFVRVLLGYCSLRRNEAGSADSLSHLRGHSGVHRRYRWRGLCFMPPSIIVNNPTFTF